MSVTIEIVPSGQKLKVPKKRLVSEVLREAGIPLSHYCAGRGVCGKCFVEILDGELPLYREREEELAKKAGLSSGHRLACLFVVESDLRIRIPEHSLLGQVAVLDHRPEAQVPFDPAVKKYPVRVPKPDVAGAEAELDILLREIQSGPLQVPMDVLIMLPAVLERSGRSVTAVVREGRELMDVEPGDSSGQVFGLAFDLGTTTLVAELVDLVTGRTVGRETGLNSQASFGADVVSRISLAFENRSRAAALKRAVLSDMIRMTRSLLGAAGLSSASVWAVSIAGNTAMNHLLLGLPVGSLAVAPFNPVFSSVPELSASELNLDVHPRAAAYIAPNIRSFVGGDISAGLVASGFTEIKGNALYLDLGTNGEIVLKKGRKLVATSTAAGPAFEGTNISCGMLALPGAVYKVEREGDGFRLITVGGGPARGVCGTGLIDAVSLSLDRGLVSPQGRVMTPSQTIALAEGVVLTPKDIRELQLAAGAVKTGVRMMLEGNRLKAEDLEEIFIAGAFGSYLSIENSIRLGLLPDVNQERFRFLGNAALAGAKAFLVSVPARRQAEETACKVEHFALASRPTFEEAFLSSLEFGKWR